MKPLLALLLVVLLSACGVPEDDQPRALPGLKSTPTATPNTSEPTGDVPVQLWFVQDDVLVAVEHRLDGPVSPEDILEELFAGPTTPESEAGLSSAIPAAFEVEDIELNGGIAVVTLSGVTEASRNDSVVAFGQIVTTLDTLPNITGVRFRTQDGDIGVPQGNGNLTDAAVNRESYIELFTPRGQRAEANAVPPAEADAVPPAEAPAAP